MDDINIPALIIEMLLIVVLGLFVQYGSYIFRDECLHNKHTKDFITKRHKLPRILFCCIYIPLELVISFMAIPEVTNPPYANVVLWACINVFVMLLVCIVVTY
jgi:hypothetical protein